MSSRPRSLRHQFLSASLAAFVATAGVFSQDTATPPSKQIDDLLTRTFPADVPGAAVIVVHKGEVLLRNGYGSANLELGVPMKPEHVFRLGSITKQFTAVAILQLVEAGKLKLDDDITSYVPEVRTDGHKITLAHLLTHTSGIPSFTDQAAWRAAPRVDMSLAQTLEYIKDKPFHFAPGTHWRYSNTGFRLLGAVIEKVTGQSYAEYIEARIFKPAGMTHSSYDDTTRVIPQRLPGYSGGPGGKPTNAPYVSMTQPHAAGALLSNVDDLWKWQQALAAGKLVSREVLNQAFIPAQLSDGRSAGYGFGWTIGSIGGKTSIEHGGGIQGFSTFALSVPDAELYVAVLCNSDQPKMAPGAISTRIANLVLGKSSPIAAAIPAEALQAYAGVYRVGPAQKIGFSVEKDRLVFTDSRGRSAPLDAISPSEFFAAASEMSYRFSRDAANTVKMVRIRPRAGMELDALRVDEPLQDSEKPAVVVAGAVLDKYIGDYELMPNFVLSVKREDDHLTAQATNQPRTTLIAESPTRFRVREVPATIEFTETDGVTSLVLHQNGNELPGKRLKQ